MLQIKKATEVRDKIFEIERELHGISEAISKGITFDGIDETYLRSKFKGITNIIEHITKNQLN